MLHQVIVVLADNDIKRLEMFRMFLVSMSNLQWIKWNICGWTLENLQYLTIFD